MDKPKEFDYNGLKIDVFLYLYTNDKNKLLENDLRGTAD